MLWGVIAVLAVFISGYLVGYLMAKWYWYERGYDEAMKVAGRSVQYKASKEAHVTVMQKQEP